MNVVYLETRIYNLNEFFYYMNNNLVFFWNFSWAVIPDVVQKYAFRLVELCGFQGLSNIEHKITKEFLVNLVIPPWEFLTDVASLTLRSNRLSASSRRSLETVNVSTDPVLESVPIVVEEYSPKKMDPFVALEQLTVYPNSSSPICTDKIDESESKFMPNALSTNLENTITDALNTSFSKRKRLTLESFFNPPAKRSNTSKIDSDESSVKIQNDGSIILLDD